MQTETQKTEIDNLRIHSQAKDKVLEVIEAYRSKMGVKPTLTEAILLMGDHYLNHLAQG